jgi:hypothetical protein
VWYFLLLFFHITKSYRFELEEHVFLIILLTMILIFETLQNVFTVSVPGKCYPRNTLCTLNEISMLFNHSVRRVYLLYVSCSFSRSTITFCHTSLVVWYFLLLFFHITKSYRFELEEHVFLIILLTMILILDTLQNVYLTTTLIFWKTNDTESISTIQDIRKLLLVRMVK